MRKQIEQMNKQGREGLDGLNYAGLQSSKQLHHRYYKDKPIGETARRQKRVCTHLVKTSPGKAAPSTHPTGHRVEGGRTRTAERSLMEALTTHIQPNM